jgi:DNA-binding MarR family transcriptional regulator
MDRLAVEIFGKIGLSPSHAFVILALIESPGHSASPSGLARVMNLDSSTVTRLISLLERRKYVNRVKDGRRSMVHLEKSGEALLPEIRASWRELYKRYGIMYGADEANRLNRLIGRVIESKKKP